MNYFFLRRKQHRSGEPHLAQTSLTLLLWMIALLVSSCGSASPIQQQAQQDQAHLQQVLQQAQTMGVPQAALKSIAQQKQALDQTHVPWTIFNYQPASTYFQNLITRYQQLTLQTQAVIQVTTEQSRGQAQTDLLTLQKALALNQTYGLPISALSQVYDQQSSRFSKVSTPAGYAGVSSSARDANAALNMLPHTISVLKTYSDALQELKNEQQDISVQQQQYDDDSLAISKAVTPGALQKVEQRINSQNQSLAMQYQNLIPGMVNTQLNTLAANVKLMQQEGINVTAYQKALDDDQAQGAQVKTMQQFLAFSKKIDADTASMQTDLVKGQAMALVSQFHQEVNAWGNAHLYHDIYDGKNYPLDNSYMAKGIGEDLDHDLSGAQTMDDYQQVITLTKNEIFHLQMLEQDYTDKMPFGQVHQTDMQLLQHYNLMKGQVIVVSTVEQALRLYQDGKLVQGFLVTAGRPELPTVPGLWRPLWRETNITFHSPYPPGSPYYYEPTKINYAILYHLGGYYLHDSWWRNDYGPGTQFYHIDSSGNVSASYGTHGCVNIREDQAAWLYNQTSYNTSIIIY